MLGLIDIFSDRLFRIFMIVSARMLDPLLMMLIGYGLLILIRLVKKRIRKERLNNLMKSYYSWRDFECLVNSW